MTRGPMSIAEVAVWSTQAEDLFPQRAHSARLETVTTGPDPETQIRAEIATDYPWVEPGDAGCCVVTWFATADADEEVFLTASTLVGFPQLTAAVGAFVPVPGTALRSLTLELPDDSLFAYRVVRSRDVGPDTVLDRAAWAAFTAASTVDEFAAVTTPEVLTEPSGFVRLPQARRDLWPEGDPEGRHGSIDSGSLSSSRLGRDVRFWTYRPLDATPETPRLVLLDGDLWNEKCHIADLLDHLIGIGAIRPLVVIMPEGGAPQTRMQEMALNADYVDFLERELLPYADPGRQDAPVGIGGWSLGGLTAAYAALTSPTFRTVISLSGSYWWPLGTPFDRGREAASQLLAGSNDLPQTRWYLEVGLGERIHLAENRHFAQLARARGHDVTFVEHGGAHDLLNARTGLGHALVSLFARESADA